MTYYLSLGSNIGDKLEFLKNAVKGLDTLGNVILSSAIYISEPYGDTKQDMYFNAVIKFKSELKPFPLLAELKKLENRIGRTKSYHWGPREIDIDIIEYDGPEIKSEMLNIPHIEIENRKFVLLPFMEIEKEFITRNGQSIYQILLKCKDRGRVEPIIHNW